MQIYMQIQANTHTAESNEGGSSYTDRQTEREIENDVNR